MKYSTGTLVASAIIKTTKFGETPEETEVVDTDVAVGSKVTITYALANGESETREGTVLGFQGKNRDVPRGPAQILDSVPTYMRDPDGGAYWRTLEETIGIAAIIVAPEEGTPMVCYVDNIMEIEAEPAEDD